MPAPGQPRSSVCRRLFFDDGEDDQLPAGQEDNTANALLEMMRHDNERARQKWNFDFETETPLEGRWQWTTVGSDQNRDNSLRDNETDESLSEPSSWTTIPSASSETSIAVAKPSETTTNQSETLSKQKTGDDSVKNLEENSSSSSLTEKFSVISSSKR